MIKCFSIVIKFIMTLMLHPMTLDGSNVDDATVLINVHETGNTSVTDTIDTKVATASGGVSQIDFDSQVASLQSKDIAYNNTVASHIS